MYKVLTLTSKDVTAEISTPPSSNSLHLLKLQDYIISHCVFVFIHHFFLIFFFFFEKGGLYKQCFPPLYVRKAEVIQQVKTTSIEIELNVLLGNMHHAASPQTFPN